jgi:hypothetical protein
MAMFRVEALEKFILRTVYRVEAPTAQEAEQMCREGEWPYDTKEGEEGGEEWLQTVGVEPLQFVGRCYRRMRKKKYTPGGAANRDASAAPGEEGP